MTQKQVRIDIDEFEPDRPTLPDWNNFWLIPSHSPHLREFVMAVEWNCAQKLLKIDLKETPAFSAFDWFNRFGKQFTETDDAIAICFFDEEDIELARLEFNGLAIYDHKCILDHEEESEDKGLIHELTIRYGKVKRIKSAQESIQVVYDKFAEEAEKAADAEWQEEKEMVLEKNLDKNPITG